MLKKTDAPGYLKDEATGVVLNRNESEYTKHMMERRKAKEHKQVRDDVALLKNEVEKIQKMLHELRTMVGCQKA